MFKQQMQILSKTEHILFVVSLKMEKMRNIKQKKKLQRNFSHRDEYANS